MHRKTLCAMALAVAWSAPLSVRAQDAELTKIRDEIRQMKEAYEKRIEALEKRLQETEAKAGQAADSAAQAQSATSTATQTAAQASSRPAAENALNPGISAILNGVYSNLKQDPNTYRINGFVPTMGDVGPGRRGLSLGESELGFTANIDHMFRGSLIASISPDNSSIDVEEGYIQTIGLSNGFSVKAGRFFSAVGYQNQIHAHAWDFTDAPLAMKAFLGNQLNDDGIQVKWVAPTDLYFDVGMEVARGRAFPATSGGGNKNGFGSGSLFTHLGGRYRFEYRVADGALLSRHLAAEPDLRRSRFHRDAGDEQLQRGFTAVGGGRRAEVGAERQHDLHELQAARRIFPAH